MLRGKNIYVRRAKKSRSTRSDAASTAPAATRGPELITATNFSGGTVTNGAGTAIATINGDGSLTLTGGSTPTSHFWSINLPTLEAGSTYEIIVPGVNSGGGSPTIILGGTSAGSLSSFTGTLTRQIVAGSADTLLSFFLGGTMTSSGRSEVWGPALSLKKVLA